LELEAKYFWRPVLVRVSEKALESRLKMNYDFYDHEGVWEEEWPRDVRVDEPKEELSPGLRIK